MKLTTKNVMFILMSVLLVLTVFMALFTLGRVGDLLQPGGNPNVNVPQGNNPGSNSVPGGASNPSHSTQYIPGHEHAYTIKGSVHSPKCDTLGYTEYYCECGDFDFLDFQSALGHKYGEYSVIAATCETDGWTERTCSRCNMVEKTHIVTASHNFDEWASINSADGEATQEERVCYGCGMTEIRSSDPANTWMIRLTELEAQGDFVHYRIVVDLADSESDPVHDIYSALIEPLWFDCVDGELWVYFCTEEIYTPFTVSPDNTVVTFYADGNISLAEPVITPEPDTPDPENPDPGTENPDPGTGDGGTGEESTGEEGTGGDETPSGDITP